MIVQNVWSIGLFLTTSFYQGRVRPVWITRPTDSKNGALRSTAARHSVKSARLHSHHGGHGMLCFYSYRDAKHQPNMNFSNRLQTEINYNRTIKICFVVNFLVSVLCMVWLSFVTIKLNRELDSLQDHVFQLNKMIKLLSTSRNLNENNQANQASHSKFKTSEMQLIQQIEQDAEEKYTNDETNENHDYLNVMTNINHRFRRANKQRKQNNRQQRQSGVLATHFKGGVPLMFADEDNQGLVGPWYPDHNVTRSYWFSRFHMTEGKCSVEVTEPALYLIYAQLYYLTSSSVNSYSIYVRSEGSSQKSVIAKCSAIGPNSSHSSGLSCYTSAIYSLKINDRVFIQQTEKNITIMLEEGHSFFGLVRLGKHPRKKQNA